MIRVDESTALVQLPTGPVLVTVPLGGSSSLVAGLRVSAAVEVSARFAGLLGGVR